MAVIAVFLYAANPPPAQASHLCGNTGSPVGPFGLETYEAADWQMTYSQVFSLAAFSRLFPFGIAGDTAICGDWNGDGMDTSWGTRRYPRRLSVAHANSK